MITKNLTVLLYKEDDMYVAECVEVGTVDQGETIEEAINNLREATRLYLEECPTVDLTPKFVTTME
ncbi:MAG: type II toxin-antitoxin system HicB family antitoxin, partial [Microcystaceae cyanobacterium]